MAAPPTLTQSLSQSPSTTIALLSTPSVVSTFNPEYKYPFIACTASSGLAWVKTGDTCIKQMDRHGTVKDTVSTDFGFNDITVTLLGDILFSDVENKRIMLASKRVMSWRFNTLVSTQYTPCGICCLHNGDIIVTHPWNEHRVIQCNSAGDIMHEFDESVFTSPVWLAVNAVNDALYAFDSHKQTVLRFGTYHSLCDGYTESDTKSFDPGDICTDRSGRVLITDTEKNRIHILDIDGNLIRYLQPPGLKEPLYIDVNSEGNAWIWERDGGQVKIIKYQ